MYTMTCDLPAEVGTRTYGKRVKSVKSRRDLYQYKTSSKVDLGEGAAASSMKRNSLSQLKPQDSQLMHNFIYILRPKIVHQSYI